MSLITRSSKYSLMILRLGLGIVVLWFGINQFLHPAAWTSYVPAWTSFTGLSAVSIVYLNGVFEIITGACLVFGIYAQLAALVLFLHFLPILWEVGLTPIGMRDFGLTMALLALALHEKDEFSIL